MSMDCFGAPQDILATETSDQRSHFLADGWTASFASRFPAPPLEKGMLMPFEHGLGFHQVGRRLPSGPHARQQHPQEAKRRVKARARLSLLANAFFVEGELTSNGYHLTAQSGSLSEEGRDKDQGITDELPAEFEGIKHRQKEEFQ